MNDPKVRDAILPIFSGTWDTDTFGFEAVAGTAFLIGKRGMAITAAHVVEQIALGNSAVAIVATTGKWVPFKILDAEKHPSEDVAVLRLQAPFSQSWMTVGVQGEHQSCEYHAWGYPIAVAEMGQKYNEDRLQTPDLIFTSGYIRRRISRELPISIYRGNAFYELSEVAGDGCSGGPVIRKTSLGGPLWEVMGVYVGASDVGVSVGYATRSDAFHNWVPSLFGRTVRDESLAL